MCTQNEAKIKQYGLNPKKIDIWVCVKHLIKHNVFIHLIFELGQ